MRVRAKKLDSLHEAKKWHGRSRDCCAGDGKSCAICRGLQDGDVRQFVNQPEKVGQSGKGQQAEMGLVGGEKVSKGGGDLASVRAGPLRHRAWICKSPKSSTFKRLRRYT